MTTVAPVPDAQQLRAEIARTRAALGETVEALAAKADVKARVRHAADDATARARARAEALAGRTRTRAATVAGRTRTGAAALAGRVRARADHAAAAVTQRAGATAGTVTSTVRDPKLRRRLTGPITVLGAAAVGTVAAVTALTLRNRQR
jgi:cell division septum initiation protein DivIVA